jgi:hypothetical protein
MKNAGAAGGPPKQYLYLYLSEFLLDVPHEGQGNDLIARWAKNQARSS